MATPFDVNFTPTTTPVAQQADAYKEIGTGYRDAISDQPTVPSLITKYRDQYGVPQMQKAVQAGVQQYDELGSAIRAIPKDVAQRSQESILTQGQKNRIVQSEQAPLLEQQGIMGQNLSRMEANLGTAEANVGQMVTAEQVQQQKELDPWLKDYDNESVLSAMRMSGWTFQNQSELTRLITNAQMGMTMSENEKERMNRLALQEAQFKNSLDQIKVSGEQSRMTKQALPDLATLYGSMFG